jgi:hypothetical protein
MAGRFRHTRVDVEADPPREVAADDSRLVDWRASLKRAEHACCCPARPTVVIIMPAATGRPYPIDLLLCRHHYRVSERALATAGAAAFDTHGQPFR